MHEINSEDIFFLWHRSLKAVMKNPVLWKLIEKFPSLFAVSGKVRMCEL